ncbi:hypothetical protein [Legionella shakespearei]|uniref:Methyltransferase domain protein n=1 Tax=Legionella shakespearei DSM 23087 TaxID=1122169 RepID=A0A0W0YKH5_9GAMM|nr:hypothetical protein [Legionella shakespearei]KTD57425.1 hypothetical protein Lsha_2576 [Legionella shakespearei DSM 23087]
MNNEALLLILSKIEHQIQSCSDIEKENIKRDLQLVSNTIDSGEYQSTELLNRNRFDTQKRTYEFFSYIKGYYEQATHWKMMLQNIISENTLSILDIGPGFSPKIELALKLLNFKGNLTVLDKSESALNGLKDILALSGIPFKLNCICDDLFLVQSATYDVVTANHLFDDLMLDGFCRAQGRSLVEVYESEGSMIRTTHEIINAFDTQELEECIDQCFNSLVRPGGYLLLRHYQGITEKALELEQWYEFITRFFNKVICRLTNEAFSLRETKNSFVLLQKIPHPI